MRVVLNTKLWSDMICEKVLDYSYSKCIFISIPQTLMFRRMRKILGYLLWTRERYACEIKAFRNWSNQVKIFLIACSIKEAEKLYTALEYRSDIGHLDKLFN